MSYIGLLRGAVVELFLLLGAVGTVVLAVGYWGLVGEFLQPWFSPPFPSHVLALLAFWVCFALTLTLIRWTVRGCLALLKKWDKLTWLIQVFGLILGCLRGAWWAGFFVVVLAGSGIPYLKASLEERSMAGPVLLEPYRRTLTQAISQLPRAAVPAVLVPPVIPGND